jgi:integral membrane protein (TIGR01906 family)
MKAIKVIITITVPIVLIMFFASILTTKSYLMLSKGKYPSHELIEYDQDYAIEHIMGYLNYQYDDLEFGANETDETILLRDIEIRHMVDVKNLYTTLRLVAASSFILAVSLSFYLYKKNKTELYKVYKYLYVGPALFVSLVGGYILIDFQTAFTIFHKLFFTNDDWQLYSNDVLILLLPQNFWMVSGIIILSLFSLSLGLIYYLNEKLLGNKVS